MTGIDKSYSILMRNSGDLVAFSVAFRERNLTRAAARLGVSQPSLSKRIRNLETVLGGPLFHRTSKGLEPNGGAAALFDAIREPLARIERAFETTQDGNSIQPVLIGTDFAFAPLWLLPKLSRIRADLGELNIQVLSSQTPDDAANKADLTISLAEPHRATAEMRKLFQEKVSAVASPGYLEEVGPLDDFDAIADHKFIHLANVVDRTLWYDWDSWIAEAAGRRIKLPSQTVLNSYEMVLQLARTGQGIALGWHGLIDADLASGALVLARDDVVASSRAYYVRRNPLSGGDALRVERWIVDACLTP